MKFCRSRLGWLELAYLGLTTDFTDNADICVVASNRGTFVDEIKSTCEGEI